MINTSNRVNFGNPANGGHRARGHNHFGSRSSLDTVITFDNEPLGKPYLRG
jgi:hypothetical protein